MTTESVRNKAVALVVACVLLALYQGAGSVRADHADGNIYDCDGVPCSVNYWLVEEGELRVCDSSELISTSQFNDGLAYWNDGLGWTALRDD